MTQTRPLIAAMIAAALTPAIALGQTTSGTPECSTIIQAAANGAAARVAADDKDINPPQAIKSLTCLDHFFQGTGLNVIINLLDPTALLQAIEGQICNAITNSWKNALGTQQCGITLTGFNTGFFGGSGKALGGGFSCPKLTFGGGGPPIGYIGVGANNSGKFTITGKGLPPTGYQLPTSGGLW
ncbi:hypothetical protein RZS28_18860 (plasmid) [Methylocapsa polymorpha]|uniref:Uncharacterized protein n=1 Tax=Methylocapsa polymorpha TaxID=3080828 RepID=A0ABZ0HYB9_9HYPH|nr:hypothetical protein [Methylocapsa sp. RX1]WOJ91791.1 hypothetical protein RZS28_18860 [Methylocapsa sp. RX1]